MIDLHNENKTSYKFSDPLCIALQILNHIQDCKEDYSKINRVYLPSSFLEKYNVKLSQLKKDYTEKNLRLAINETLFHTEKLIKQAEKFKKIMTNHRLSKETIFILEIAKSLLKLLKKKDPLKNKVVLNKFDYIKCLAKAFFNY